MAAQAKVMPGTEPDSEPPVFGRAASDGIVIIEIGAEQRKYYIHKALLTHHSEYFHHALSGSWKEAQEGVVPLHDIDNATCMCQVGEYCDAKADELNAVNIYVHWLYTQTMPSDKQMPSITELEDLKVDDEDEQAPLLWVYVRAYIFGDRVLSPAFRSKVLEGLNRDYLSSRLPYKETAYSEVIAYAFANAASDCEILFDLVEDYALTWMDSTEGWEDEVKDACFGIDVQERLPSAFLVRVMNHRVKNGAEERQTLLEWVGAEEDMTKWLGVKDVLLSM